MYIGTYQQRRTIWMDGRPHPPEYAPHTFMGFSTGEWNGDILTITTTHIKAGYFRRSGMPASDRTTVVEHWMRHGNVLSQVTIATDPVYLTEPYIRSQEFVLMERGNTNWLYNCEYAMEVPRAKNEVPHFLPGKNPWLAEVGRQVRDAAGGRARRRGDDAAGYAETIRSGKATRAEGVPVPAVPTQVALSADARPGTRARRRGARPIHVQGNVHMIVGAGANIAVQVGDGRRPRRRHRRRRHEREGAGRDPAAVGQGDPLDRQHRRSAPITSAATSRSRTPAGP